MTEGYIAIDNTKHIKPKNSNILKSLDDNNIISTTLILKDNIRDKGVNIVNDYMKGKGLTTEIINNKNIKLKGTYKVYRNIFKVEIDEYSLPDNVKYYANKNNIEIPNQLSQYIEGILGFDSVPFARTHIFKTNDTLRPNAMNVYTPIQLAQLYNFPSNLTGKNQVIAMIELGGGYNQSDLNQYFINLGYKTPPKVISVSVDGATNNPGDSSNASLEVVLDIEIAAAIAPDATIVVYFAPNSYQGFYDAIQVALNDTVYKPSIISISWGISEYYWPVSILNNFNTLLATSVNKNVTICVASGDNGSSDGVNDGRPHADFPSSSPYVLGCGGTTLYSSNNQITQEIVWNNNGSATGGGISDVFPKPSYQSALSIPRRGIPDVCGNADPSTGYLIYINGQQVVVGGTSAVAPLWSGLLARINQYKGSSVGFINPIIYNNRSGFRDILVGSNGAYNAQAGWDPCTGLGSPNGVGILNTLTQSSNLPPVQLGAITRYPISNPTISQLKK